MNSVLEQLEDPDRPYLGPNYWILKKAGILLPKNGLSKLIYFIIHASVTTFVITEYMELYVIRHDLHMVLTTIRIAMLSTVCMVKIITFLIWQDEWEEVIEYVNNADKFERDNRDQLRGEIIDAYTKYSRNMTYFYWFLSFSTFLAGDLAPVMRYLSTPTFRENLRNGTESFPHIFSSWVPFDKNHSPGCWITVAWHGFLCFYGNFYIGAFDSCILALMIFFGGKINLLRVRCEQIFNTDQADMKEFRKCIREIHNMHIDLIKNSRLFNSVLSPALFLYIAVCALMLCASIYQFDSGSSAAEQVMLAQYLMFGIAQLILFCWHGNDVLYKSENLSHRVYDSNWYNASVLQRKYLLILQIQLRTTVVFTAGPFTNLTLPTFFNIMKAAYSYYTLIRK